MFAGIASKTHSVHAIGLLITLPGRGAEYCDQPICLCVCVSAYLADMHISGTAELISTIFCVWIHCSHGSVLLRWHCAMLCTSGFMDDVTFGRNGRDAGRRRLTCMMAMHDVAIPGWSLMSMNACCIFVASLACSVRNKPVNSCFLLNHHELSSHCLVN